MHVEGAILNLLDASEHIDEAVEHMQQIVNDNQREGIRTLSTLQLIDNLDLLHIYTLQIERIAKEMWT